MKGQKLTRTQRETRTTRRHRRNRQNRYQAIWYTIGIALTITAMTHYNLWQPMEVLAVLGVIEVGAKLWNAIWKWFGA